MGKIKTDFPCLSSYINNVGHDFSVSEAFTSDPCPERLAESYFCGIRVTEEVLPLIENSGSSIIADLSLLTLGSAGLRAVDAVKKTIASYYDMLCYSLRESNNIKIYTMNGQQDDNGNQAGPVISGIMDNFRSGVYSA